MRHLVGAVSVVTSGRGALRTGATVTSAHSLSIEPETMLVSINRSSSSWPVIRDSGAFCVNLLAADQQAVADRFAGRGGLKGIQRYEGAEWIELATGSSVLIGALASVDCEVEHVVEHHSHALIFGSVRAIVIGEVQPALLYAHGRYAAFEGRDID
jgi:flavin reductase (DIM6/NTAB) family NADH-FMN oxidoreductase RutF